MLSSAENTPTATITPKPPFCCVVSKGDPPIYVTDLSDNDILLGRGAPIINYIGNIKFRLLVQFRKPEYISTAQHRVKDEVARSILAEISSRRGRFLCEVKGAELLRNKDLLPKDVKVYRIADEFVVLEKIKQALRDRIPTKDTKRAATAAEQSTAQLSSTSSCYSNVAATDHFWRAPYGEIPGLPDNISPTFLSSFASDGMRMGMLPAVQQPPFNSAGTISTSQRQDPPLPTPPDTLSGMQQHMPPNQHQSYQQQQQQEWRFMMNHQRLQQEQHQFQAFMSLLQAGQSNPNQQQPQHPQLQLQPPQQNNYQQSHHHVPTPGHQPNFTNPHGRDNL